MRGERVGKRRLSFLANFTPIWWSTRARLGLDTRTSVIDYFIIGVVDVNKFPIMPVGGLFLVHPGHRGEGGGSEVRGVEVEASFGDEI